jgi:hypothetical protein
MGLKQRIIPRPQRGDCVDAGPDLDSRTLAALRHSTRRAEISDDWYRLLREHHERPRNSRTAEKCDELASPHGLHSGQGGHATTSLDAAVLCITAKFGGQCLLWVVIRDRGGRSHTTVHVRFAPKADKGRDRAKSASCQRGLMHRNKGRMKLRPRRR